MGYGENAQRNFRKISFGNELLWNFGYKLFPQTAVADLGVGPGAPLFLSEKEEMTKGRKPCSFIFETQETEYGKRAESFDRQFSILGWHNPSGRAKTSAFSCPDLLPNRKQRIINSSTATIYLRASSCKLSVIVLVVFTSQEWHNYRLKNW